MKFEMWECCPVRGHVWLGLVIALGVTWFSHAQNAFAQQGGSPTGQSTQLRFETLVDRICYVAEFKLNVPDTYELIYKYNLTLAQAENLPQKTLQKCGLPARPARTFDADGHISQAYIYWRRELMVNLHPKNADKLLNPDIVKLDPIWRTQPLQPDSYLRPVEGHGKSWREVRSVTPGGAPVQSLPMTFRLPKCGSIRRPGGTW